METHTESSTDSLPSKSFAPFPSRDLSRLYRTHGRRQHGRVRLDESLVLGRRRRTRRRGQLAAPASPVPDLTLVASLNQVHGNVVHAATRDTAALRPAGDGMVTAEPGVMLGIFTADCVPILLVDSKRRIAGALHAGWRERSRISPARAFAR